MTAYASMTTLGLDRAGLKAMANHAKREDKSSQKRIEEAKVKGVYSDLPPWTKLGAKLQTIGRNLDPLDYDQLANAHLQATGAELSKRAQKHWKHFIVPMPKELEPVDALFEIYADEFEAWAEANGIDVLGFRVDRDEEGKHILDVLTAPTSRTKTGNLQISPTAYEYSIARKNGMDKIEKTKTVKKNGKEKEVKVKVMLGTNQRATLVQDDFAQHMIEHLAPKIGVELKRGKTKTKKGTDKLPTTEFKQAKKEELGREITALERRKAEIADEIEQERLEALCEAKKEFVAEMRANREALAEFVENKTAKNFNPLKVEFENPTAQKLVNTWVRSIKNLSGYEYLDDFKNENDQDFEFKPANGNVLKRFKHFVGEFKRWFEELAWIGIDTYDRASEVAYMCELPKVLTEELKSIVSDCEAFSISQEKNIDEEAEKSISVSSSPSPFD